MFKGTSKLVWFQRIGFVAVVAFLIWYIPQLDITPILKSIKSAHWHWVAVGVFFVFGFWISRSALLWRILSAKQALSFKTVLLANIIGMTTDQLIPGRVGFVARWGIIVSRTQLSKAFVVFALAGFVLMEAVGLISFCLIGLGLQAGNAQEGISASVVLSLAGVIGLIAIFVFCFPWIEKWSSKNFIGRSQIFQRFAETVHLARNPKTLCLWIFISLFVWFVQVYVLFFAAYAFDVELKISTIVLTLLAINIAIAVPVVPGNIGSIEIVVTTILKSAGVVSEKAIAIAVIYHAMHLVPLLIVGGLTSVIAGVKIPRKAEAFDSASSKPLV